jgi:protein SMG6
MVSHLRMEIERRLEQALLLDLDLANQKNVEQLLWKSAFYQVIEMLRHQSSESDSSEFYKQQLLTVLDEVGFMIV